MIKLNYHNLDTGEITKISVRKACVIFKVPYLTIRKIMRRGNTFEEAVRKFREKKNVKIA